MTQNSAGPSAAPSLSGSAIYGFEANAAQSPETLKGIKYMMGLVPAAAALISGLFMIFYKLSDQKMTQIIADLESQRAAENS